MEGRNFCIRNQPPLNAELAIDGHYAVKHSHVDIVTNICKHWGWGCELVLWRLGGRRLSHVQRAICIAGGKVGSDLHICIQPNQDVGNQVHVHIYR